MARSPQPPGRRGAPEYVEGAGEDEDAALTYLALALEERQGDARRTDLRLRGQLAYIQSAEEESPRTDGYRAGSRQVRCQGLA